MSRIAEALTPAVESGSLPGVVALAQHRDGSVEEAVLGSRAVDGPPMTRDSIFRIASITKPIVAVATMTLVEEGVLDLDAPVARWLPELETLQVLRAPDAELDDTVPAVRPVTTRHLLTFTAGWGFPSDFSLPVVKRLGEQLAQGAPTPHAFAAPDEWIRRLADTPLLHQPGEGWLYNTGSDVLGVLLARASGRSLPDLLAERVFTRIGMPDTAFHVPEDKLGRLVTWYFREPSKGSLVPLDAPPGNWATPPAFPAGASGLVSTADDWLAFGRMLLAQGEAPGGRVLRPESVRELMTDHVAAELRAPAQVFLGSRGWGYGGTVDLVADRPGRVPGRYGWVGGTGTSGFVSPATGEIQVFMSQVQLAGPSDESAMGDFWAACAETPATP
ncbi:MAG TPA: serine hydrolase domain-containing protein [Dermatophilaceae bacterium]|nr:serine hydrolase domain-containing protein [Dermatophilaceae bacterium]